MAEHELALPTAWGQLAGTLLLPEGAGPWPAALLIAGSGPTDRDGNNLLMEGPCDTLKLLARELGARGIASLRYDKRGVGGSSYPGLSEAALRFDHLVDDAVLLGRLLQSDGRLGELTLLGHSEGALIASLAAEALQPRAVVCVAGAGEKASAVIRRQVQHALPPDLLQPALSTLEAMEAGREVQDVPDALVLLFRPTVQPYMISWFAHDPPAVLGRLQVPVLLVHGALDTQVGVEHVRWLHAGKPDARLRIVEGMDHSLGLAGDVALGAQAVAAEVAAWLEGMEVGQAA